jgi:integrase
MTLDVLPPRQGERPETGPAVPHVQFTQTSPPEIHAELEEVSGRVRVHRSVTAVDGVMIYSAPKSHQARTVALPQFLIDALREHLRGRDLGALAFPDSRGGPLRLSNVRQRWWTRAVADSGAPEGCARTSCGTARRRWQFTRAPALRPCKRCSGTSRPR